MQCKICQTESLELFRNKVLNKYDIQYFYCRECGFIQTENPFWLEEAYNKSITRSDTGIIARNFLMAEKIAPVIYFFLNRKGTFVDWGGGYGLFVRIMRDIGFDFKWHDPYSCNIFAEHFEFDQTSKVEALTCWEVFEHLPDPLQELHAMLEFGDTVIFSTRLHKFNQENIDRTWDYFSPEHGQHIAFYTYETLQRIANLHNLYLYSNRDDLHILSRHKPGPAWLVNLMLCSKRRSCLFIAEIIKLLCSSKTISDSNLIKTGNQTCELMEAQI